MGLCTATMKSRVSWSRQFSPSYGVSGSSCWNITKDRCSTIVLTFSIVIHALNSTKLINFSSRLSGMCLPEIVFSQAVNDLTLLFVHWLQRIHVIFIEQCGYCHWTGSCISQSHDIINQWPPLTDWNLLQKCKILQNYDCIKILT